MHRNTELLEGKTIKSINKDAINTWVVTFTDGTVIRLWAEIDGPHGLGQLYIDDLI